MDYSLSKKSLSVSETVFEGCLEQPIDLDFSLPDYCPDIQRILKCQVYPKIFTRNVSGDRLDVDGAAVVRILYIDAVKKSVRCSEHTAPFTCSFNLKATPQNAVVLASAKPEYLNCRALSPRRLDIHGAFSVCAKVVSKSERENVCGIDGDDIQMMKESHPVSTITGCGQQLFTVSEDIELGSGKPPIESILRTDARAYLTECKAITNKMMIKADLNLKVLYLADLDTGAVEVLDYTVPVSQIIDVDGIDENAVCDTMLEVMTYDVRVRNDLSENDTVLSLESKLCATVTSYGEDEAQVVTDAYSTVYDLDLTYGQVQMPKLVTIINDTCVNKSTVEANSAGITKMLDLWNEQCTVKALEENGRMVLTGKLNICILALDNEDSPFYTERSVDFTYPMNLDCDIKNLIAIPQAQVVSVSYRLSDSNHLDLRTEIKLSVPVFEHKSVRGVTAASANEEHLRQKDDSVALILYYAGDGEKVWDIARDYCICCDAVKAENDMAEDTVAQGRMLLIPNI